MKDIENRIASLRKIKSEVPSDSKAEFFISGQISGLLEALTLLDKHLPKIEEMHEVVNNKYGHESGLYNTGSIKGFVQCYNWIIKKLK